MRVFLPSRREVLNAIPTAEHLRATNGIRFTCGPSPHNRQRLVLVKVLLYGATTRCACQATRRSRGTSPAAIRIPLRPKGWRGMRRFYGAGSLALQGRVDHRVLEAAVDGVHRGLCAG